MDIEKRSAGGLAINSLAPTRDSKDLAWVSAATWVWKNYIDLPQDIQSEFVKEKLVPSTILMDSIDSPFDGDVMPGWMAGPDRFSTFTLNKKTKSVKGHVYTFAEPAVVKKTTIPSDLLAGGQGSGSITPPSQEEKDLQIDLLPATVRRMILAVRNPIEHQFNRLQSTSADSSTMTMTVNFSAFNKTHFIAVNGVQKVIGNPGTSDDVLQSLIARSPWQMRVIYNKLS